MRSSAGLPPLLLPLLLLSGRAAFTACRSLNAAQDRRVSAPDGQTDGTDGPTAAALGADRRRRLLLAKTRPFILVDGQRRSLARALQDGHPDRLQGALEVGGRLLVLDLEKNHQLLPKPPNVFLYLPNGTGVSLPADPVTHCYYHGNVRGFPQSRVAVSTCSGLRGVIALNSSLSFELEPEEHLLQERRGEEEQSGSGAGADEGELHLLFSTAPLDTPSSRVCGVPHTAAPPIHSPPHTRRTKRDILTETKYIELVLVADHQEFLNYQKNNKTIIYRMLDVANQVDWFYRPLNVRVALTGLEIWSDRDKIRVEKSATDTLNNFLDWRTRDLLPRLRHDNAQLVMGESFDGTTVGMASQSSMCSRDRSGGVNVDHLVSVLGVASTIAHELGHNLGMRHDTAERRCSCQNEPRLGGCIMEPSTGFLPGQQFSSCSVTDLTVSLQHGGGMCLFNVPQPDRLLGGPRCGNLYVEKGEECDCGLLQECEDPCCNASTCRLVPGAQCSSDGICCQSCKLRPAGSMCREPLGDCDLPEFCSGSSPHCPPNVFLQNGELCENSTSYCYEGVCANMDTQCQMLWGPNATSAPAVCFSSVNKQGNKYGNCGQLANGSHIPCGNADVHCGRIQCQGGRERPLLGSNAQILTTTVRFNDSDLICRGTFFHLGDDVSDPATVAQGTACGPGKACFNHKCRAVSMFGVDDCRRKCNGHGVCNSNKNCHCDVGWAPPDCRYSGHGGSVDSGPARAAGGSDPVRVALLVIFFFVLPVVLLFLALRFPRFRRALCCLGQSSPFHKALQHNRTPVTERVDGRNGEQVRPLRYHLNPPPDIPLAPPQKEANDRPAPPNKPLPPDPALTPPSKPVKQRPAAPSKPLPPDPPSPSSQGRATRPAPPSKPLPPDPVSAAQVSVPLKPIVPPKPRPPAPPTNTQLPPHPGLPPLLGHASNTKLSHLGAVAPAPGSSRRPPLRPSRPPAPPKAESPV
ncbi:disintegrin and metalloproteinase domain-containing protein 15 isoform X1 [Oryzias melastigma]|uniref:disintegrin and metalloproteinase domain-containing protein 15 isoform X1 n=1 Tax=Oryzias melastigma TaxID=30732 RepID=UPI000CF7EE2F|nr:disintegrin and metalloproteinase domain-containing protein 15 isoform X1 [Oryzias melastigma]